MRKLRLMKVKELAQGYPASEQQSRQSNEVCPILKATTPECLTSPRGQDWERGPKHGMVGTV